MRKSEARIYPGAAWRQVFVLVAVIVSLETAVIAQNPGSPVVADVSVNQSNGQVTVTNAYSNAYIDASASALAGVDFCATLHNALLQLNNSSLYPSGGGVIDARGINSASFTCSSASPLNPWNQISVPATVLLPAGIIRITTTWILPSGTRLIGEGGEDPGLNHALYGRTYIQAEGYANPVIQMGVSSGCTGVVIQDLIVDGGGFANLDAIHNPNCGDQSYVNHVTLYQISGVGLSVSAPQSSGPYTNITFDPGGQMVTTSASTIGLSIGSATRGIQGVTCTTGTYNIVLTSGSSAGTCITITGGGNSVEDVRIEGFTTGVQIGASNTVLMNIDGDTNPSSKSTTLNVVSIGAGLSNVVLLGIANNCVANNVDATYCEASGNLDNSDLTIQDNSTGTNLHVSTDPFVAMYALGTQLGSGSGQSATYSRYTTSPSVANWGVGQGSPPIPPCTPGSLFSSVGGQTALYVCSAVAGVNNKTWQKVQ